MSAVFLDTVGLIALWDTDDQWHAAAEAAYLRMVAERRAALTTSYILLECGNSAARRTFRGDVCALRRALELRGELGVPTEDDWRNAWSAYEAGEAFQAGIVDHVSFAVMRPARNNRGLFQRPAFLRRWLSNNVLSNCNRGVETGGSKQGRRSKQGVETGAHLVSTVAFRGSNN